MYYQINTFWGKGELKASPARRKEKRVNLQQKGCPANFDVANIDGREKNL